MAEARKPTVMPENERELRLIEQGYVDGHVWASAPSKSARRQARKAWQHAITKGQYRFTARGIAKKTEGK
jgi:hypothetical protein